MKKRLITPGALCAFLLLGTSLITFASVEPLFHENPTQLPDLREKYDQLCGYNTSAQTVDLADLNADGLKDIVIGLWCGVPPGTVKTGLPTVGALVALTQKADKTFIDSTMSLFGSELVTIEKPFENVVYDFNADGYDDIFMTMSREDGRYYPWDVADNILNAVIMSNGDGTYSLVRTGCTQPCGTGYLVHEMDNEVGGIDVVMAPIGYGGSREVWRHAGTWRNVSTLADGIATGAMAFFKRTSAELASLRLAVSYKSDGASGVRLFERSDPLTDWTQVDAWITSIENIFSSNVTNWNGDVSLWQVTLSEGKYYSGGSFEYGCELAAQADTSLNLVYLQTGYELDDYVEGMDLIEGQGMEWIYKLFGFAATDTSLTRVPILLQASVDLTDRPYRLICEDVNSDGREDIVVSTWGYEAHPHVYINTGQNKFSLVREEVWPPMGDALKNAQPVYADVDGDGIPDVIYFSGSSVANSSNSSEIRYEIHYGKRVMSAQDTYDSDSDGLLNNLDAFPNDPAESVDTDADGVGNNADTDDDGDGLSDVEESTYGTYPLLADTDGDDYLDGEEVDSGADPLDANDNPSEGLNWHVFKAAKDQQEEAAQESN